MGNHAFYIPHIHFNLDYVEWDLSKIIFENVLNKPANEYIQDIIID